MAARETKLKRKAVAATESNGNDKSDDVCHRFIRLFI